MGNCQNAMVRESAWSCSIINQSWVREMWPHKGLRYSSYKCGYSLSQGLVQLGFAWCLLLGARFFISGALGKVVLGSQV